MASRVHVYPTWDAEVMADNADLGSGAGLGQHEKEGGRVFICSETYFSQTALIKLSAFSCNDTHCTCSAILVEVSY